MVRVNFKEKTAILIGGDEVVDLSDEYFTDSFLDPSISQPIFIDRPWLV